MTGLAPLHASWFEARFLSWMVRPFQLPLALPAGATPPPPTAPVPATSKLEGSQLAAMETPPLVTSDTFAVRVLSVTGEVFGLSKLPDRACGVLPGKRPVTVLVWWIVSPEVVAVEPPPVPVPLSVQ